MTSSMELWRLADAGNADAQYELGCDESRWTTDLGYEEADEWLRKAARQGHAKAKKAIVYRINRGGYSFPDEEVIKWTLELAEQGDPRGQYLQAVGRDCPEQSRLDWLIRSAKQEYAPAMVELGYRLANGRGIERDIFKAVEWFKQAASQGDIEAQCLLGKVYSGGYGLEPDYSEAVAWLKKPLEKNLCTALVTMGCITESRDGAMGCKKALNFYRQAIEHGRSLPILRLEPYPSCNGRNHAAYYLGRLYHEGRGVTQNDEKAVEWYAEAAKNASMLRYPTNYLSAIGGALAHVSTASKQCLKAAKSGNVDAQVEYGLREMDLACGVAKIDRAARWIEKAAKQGLSLGQYAWGGIVETVSKKKDIPKIEGWYRKAAEKGLAEGQAELGRYYRGKDYYASKLCNRRLPSGQWDKHARWEFGLFIDRRPDNKRAADWYHLAAEQGNMPAQFELGEMCSYGQGVKQDYGEAAKWLRKAIEWTYQDWASSIRQRFSGKWQTK